MHCSKNVSFQECELTILRMAVDNAETRTGEKQANSVEVKEIISIVESFLLKKSLICYGGTAINNILPLYDQFYDKSSEIPDYDFFSKNALSDAKELADIYYSKGYENVEAKSGVHHGTYKVFVNYMAIADITYLHPDIYNSFKNKTVKVDGLLYAPPNFLRMSMYLELSRPDGDVSRWEKVLKRLSILNKHYPLTQINCRMVPIQRSMEFFKDKKLFNVIYETLVSQSVVFFGAYAMAEYSKYMPKHMRKKTYSHNDFDVLSYDPKKTCEIVAERLKDHNVDKVQIVRHEPLGETIPLHYEIKLGKDTICFVYEPIACHSYNIIESGKFKIKIATIDTILSFYLAFLFTNRPYYKNFEDRIICIANLLFAVQQKNRLQQKGILRRFSISCYGTQPTLENLRKIKNDKFKELKDTNNTKKFEEWFLNYKPTSSVRKTATINTTTKRKRKRKKTIQPRIFNPYNQTRRKKTF
tara:strand:- start:190 stop:1602 length:1413 start_codon:yes stop_codon:yes gene_type:complete